MGQCSPSSPSNYSLSSMDDDELYFKVNPAGAVGCFQDLPLQRILLHDGAGDNTDEHLRSRITNHKFDNIKQKHFLQAHRPDIPQRCIVEQSELKRAVWLQSDELLRRNGRLKMRGISFDEFRNQQILPILSDQLSVPKHTPGNHFDRHQCTTILRLKMKANFGWFYKQHYLKMFPSELKSIVGTVPREETGIPELTSESSDSSFSSRCNSSNSRDTYCIKYGSIPPTMPVKCPITNESFLDLAITGCLGLVPREQDHKALRSSRRQMRDHCEEIPDHCVVLMNKRSGSPLAVCVSIATSGSPVVRIYATRQMAFAQKHTVTAQQLGLDWADDLPLYLWVEVKTEGDFPDKMNFMIYMVQRFDGCFSSQPRYKASFDGYATDGNGAAQPPVIEMVGRTDSEHQISGCALIWLQADEMMARPHLENNFDLSFHINLAQGIDPALLVCFTAIVDEILEKSMRMRCQNQTRGLIRKDSFSLTKKRLRARSGVTLDELMNGVPCKAKACAYASCNF